MPYSLKIIFSGLMVALLVFSLSFDSSTPPKNIVKNDTGTVPAGTENIAGKNTPASSPQTPQPQQAQRPLQMQPQDRPVQVQRSLLSGRPEQPRQSPQNQGTVNIQTKQPRQSQPSQPQPKPPQAPQPPKQAAAPGPNASGLTADESKMLGLVNAERAKNGLPGLTVSPGLTSVARLKAEDMINSNYFSHTSPTYGSPFDMMRKFGINYRTAGENLAGAPAVGTAHTNLMNSPGHRANILNSNYKWIGIGIVDGGPYGKMFVQMFTG